MTRAQLTWNEMAALVRHVYEAENARGGTVTPERVEQVASAVLAIGAAPDKGGPRMVDQKGQPAPAGRYVDDEAGDVVVVGDRGRVVGRYALPTAPTTQKR